MSLCSSGGYMNSPSGTIPTSCRAQLVDARLAQRADRVDLAAQVELLPPRTSAAAVCARSRMSVLFRAITTGTPALRIAAAMKRSPGPTPCWPFRTNSAASESASSRSIRFCMRWVSGSRGRCTPGRSTITSCQSSPVAMPRIARRVVCGRFETIATFSPTSAFSSVDLPTLGRPASATKPERTPLT